MPVAAALVANTGTLIEPITKDQWNQGTRPSAQIAVLAFRSDQCLGSDRRRWRQRGWGGRMADLFESMNSNASFTCISTSGTTLFLSGQTAFQLRVTAAGSSGRQRAYQPALRLRARHGRAAVDHQRRQYQPLCQGVCRRRSPLARSAGSLGRRHGACWSDRRAQPHAISRSRHRKTHQQRSGHLVADGCPRHCRPHSSGSEPPGLLCASWAASTPTTPRPSAFQPC